MPDRRKHRGKHPQDDELFAAEELKRLRGGVSDLSWLLTRGYAIDSALKLVGDRFNLTARQRLAVQRSACNDGARSHRAAKCLRPPYPSGLRLGIDGYNLLITLEGALSGGVLLVGRDGAMRDLASIHGTYRHVEETIPALRLIMAHIDSLRPASVDWYLDRPVSNSGRLKKLMAELLFEHSESSAQSSADLWNIELVDSPDRALIAYEDVVVSSDSIVLDGCRNWVNLARDIIDVRIAHAWIVNLGGE